MKGLLDEFIGESKKVWGNSKLIDQINLKVKIGKPRSGLAELRFRNKGQAINGTLISVPRNAELVVSKQFLNLEKNKRRQVLRHEGGHLGYKQHTKAFRNLMEEKEGTLSQTHLKSSGVQVQVKKGARYSTVKTLPTVKLAKEYGTRLAKRGDKIRIIY